MAIANIYAETGSGFIRSHGRTWAEARDGTYLVDLNPLTNPVNGLMAGGWLSVTEFLMRVFLYFDLSDYSASQINSVKLKFWPSSIERSASYPLTYITEGHQGDPLTVAHFDTGAPYTQRDEVTDLGNDDKTNFTLETLSEITLNAAGRTLVMASMGGTLMLCIRDDYDIEDFPFPGATDSWVMFYNPSASGKEPYLELDYIPSEGLHVVLAGTTDIVDEVLGLTTSRGRDDELADTATGQAVLTVDNNDGDYAPENAGGAYYGTLDLGVVVEIYETIGGTDYDIFKGKIDDILPKDSAAVEGRTADIVVLDGMDDMAQREISIAKLTDTSADALIDDALDDMSDAEDRSLDVGIDTFDQGWFHKEDALPAIQDVAKQDGGFFYVDVDGTRVFENRHHRLQGAHITSQHDFGASVHDIGYRYNKRFIFNHARITGKTYIADGVDNLLWSAKTGDDDEAPYISPGETLTLIAELGLGLNSYDSLVKGTHWDANTSSDGTGTDVGADIALVETQKGQAVELAFTNNGSDGAYLVAPTAPPGGETGVTALVYGKLLQEHNFTMVVEDTTSRDAYGPRSFELTARFQSRPQQVLSYANAIVAWYKDPIPTPVSFAIKGEIDATNRLWAVKLKLSDRITLASTRLSFDTDFFINRIDHNYDIRQAKFGHVTTFFVQRVSGSPAGWLLGTIGFGELGETTYLVW